MPRKPAHSGDRESFDYNRLDVYRIATEFFRASYKMSQRIPRDDSFLRWQFLRSALSVKANIAEGSGEIRPKEKARFYRMARRSAYESASLLEEIDLLIKPAETDLLYSMLRRISTMLLALCRRMETRGVKPTPGRSRKTAG